MRLQQKISLEMNQAWVGRQMDVLIEDSREGWLIGRSHRDAPEIDGLVFVEGDSKPGDIVRVEVTGAEEYDLYARQINMPFASGKRLTQLRQASPSRPL